MITDDELMEEIEAFVAFALKRFQGAISTGTDPYDYVENNLSITPVGILPLDNDEGYFFLCDGRYRSIEVTSTG